jgi:hypothetical protein
VATPVYPPPPQDQVGKDEIWMKVLKWFIERFEQ